MSNINDAVISMLNSIAMCENTQDYLEINCGKGEIIKDVNIQNRIGYTTDMFDGAVLKLIKSNKEVNLTNLIEIAGAENSLAITDRWLEHIKLLNKQYNRLNKHQEITSIEQYMVEISHNKDVKMPYPLSTELKDIKIETESIANLPLLNNGIILANLSSSEKGYLNGLSKLSENNLVCILSTDYLGDNLKEVDLSDFMDNSSKRSKKNSKYYFYVFNNGYLINNYF
ncbi:MAG: hypothetical protein J6A59_09860 [Lachnospiraceae bacterium]|nr:hypothetical protein [Lachnospiraceae bacterium]